MRTIAAALIVTVALAAPGAARADLPPDERRAHDTFYQWTLTDDFGGHNHASVVLYGPTEYPDQADGDWSDQVRRVEVTTYQPGLDGSMTERTFAADVGHPSTWFEGRGGFTEGPCFPCGPYGTLWFALPHDYGDSDAIVDIRLWLARADGPCEDAPLFGPCGGSVAGYLNPGFVGIPNVFDTDMGDALPFTIRLH